MSDSGGGFIDLRVGHGASGVGDDSVWPSFTDIMTVIVMIFLMALVVIMVRNFELDRELLSTISAKEATQLANQDLTQQKTELESTLELTETEKASLEESLKKELARIAALSANQAELQGELEKLISARQSLEQSNAELEQSRDRTLKEVDRLLVNEQLLNERISSLSERLSLLQIQSDQQITELTDETQTLGEKLDTVSLQLASLKQLLTQSQTENKSLSEEVSELQDLKSSAEESYSIAESEIQSLKELINQRESENAALQVIADTSNEQFQSLQQEYENLDQEYRKLIRPARSSAGKYIVEIWVEKVAGALLYEFKESNNAERLSIERAQLESTLQSLKDQHGKSLYTRIIIPEDSQLTHNEAWKFTQDILQKYDYYYQ